MDYKCHIYDIDGVRNMRDIGGYQAGDGRAVTMGTFIRSTALAKIDAEGERALRDIGVDCVIDLRSRMEREMAPDVIENSTDIRYMHVPMLDYISSNMAAGNFMDFPKSMPEMYIGLLENGKADFKRIFEIFADTDYHHYLFHCTAGKDRTGVTAMLLLDLAGVDEDTIIEDYAYTQTLLDWEPMGVAPVNVPQYLFEAVPETMRATLDYLRSKYGNAAGYLADIGIDEQQRRAIIAKLFEDR